MTVDLKISVENGNVTITVGGKTIAARAAEVQPDPTKLGPLVASVDLGPKSTTDPDVVSHEDAEDAGGAPQQDPTDPGGGPGQASVMVVIGSIVVNPCVCGGKDAPVSRAKDSAAQ